MKDTPHLRITAQETKDLYLSGLLTTHAYLYLLIGALRKDGWWLHLKSVPEFCQEWGIPERSFYRAKAILVSQGYLEEDIQGPLGLRRPPKEKTTDTALPEVAVDCNKWQWTAKSGSDGLPEVAEGLQQVAGELQQVAEGTATSGRTTPLKPAHSKDSRTPTDLDQIYTTYIHREEESLNANKQPIDPDPIRDPGSDPIRDPDPLSDPGTQFTQGPSSSLHKETMGSLGSNSMSGNSLSSRFDVKQILEETKRKLMEQVQWQRSQRMQRWATSRVSGTESFVLPVGTQGSSLTPDSSDPIMTTTSTFPSSAKPAMLHPSYETPLDG